jgi:PAT family beta-lactamase induction signal transducer AmpG
MTDKKYTATQYALFASLAALGKTLFGGGAGYLVEGLGYQQFFIMGSLLALPGLYLAYRMNKSL